MAVDSFPRSDEAWLASGARARESSSTDGDLGLLRV